jgi:phage terminase large subunit-like protein
MDIINNKENRALLTKYLIKLYGKEKAKEMLLKYKNNLFGKHGLAYLVGKRSIEFFCKYFLQDFFMPKEGNTARNLAPVHYEIWEELENIFIHNTHDKQEFILPRGCAKTTIIDMALCTYLHVYLLSRYTIVLANRSDDAEEFVEKTKKALQTPYIVHTFGNLINPRYRTVNKSELELDNDSKIEAYSAGSSVRGASYSTPVGIFRPMLYLADDFISENDILTEQSKIKKYQKWLKEIEEGGDSAVIRDGRLIKPASKFLVIGTPLSPGDFIDQIRTNTEYKVFHRSVVDFDIDDYFENSTRWQQFRTILFDDKRADSLSDCRNYYFEHKEEMDFPTIWEKYNCLDLGLKYFTKRLEFTQELMCKCENIGDKWFTSNKVRDKEEIESLTHIKTMLSIDTAGVKNKDKRRSDFFAFTVGSVADNGFKYVRKGQIRKFDDSFDAYINHVIELLKEFEDITHVFIEKNTYNGLDVERIEQEIEKIPKLLRRRIIIINEMQRKNKDDKISTIVSDINNGRIIFCAERVEKDFLTQLMEFSGQMFTRHDDAVDSVAEFANRIDEIQVKNKRIRTMDRRTFGI